MPIDLDAATDFMSAHARLLDRRRFELLMGRGTAAQALAALDGYRNPDGGYGAGIEPDLRDRASQPVGALHAGEVLEVVDDAGDRPRALFDWLGRVTLPDGGLPFALPIGRAAGCAPFWAGADATVSSLHITACVAGAAHRVAKRHPMVADHPWLVRARLYCLDRASEVGEHTHALELMYVLQLLEVARRAAPSAGTELTRLAGLVPADGRLLVAGGADDEFLGPLDLSPKPTDALRSHLSADLVSAALDELVADQQPDGGWSVRFASYSPAAALEWRGYATVHALTVLRDNGRLKLS